MPFEPIDAHLPAFNPFERFGRDWALLTAGDAEGVNTMTVSWGGLGVLWNLDVATVYVRPQRYTKEFIERTGRFTLSFYAPEHKAALGVLGRVSGRDEDKVARVGFTPVELDGDFAFEEAELVLACRVLYADEIDPKLFRDASCDARNYPERDYHTAYIGEVERTYVRARGVPREGALRSYGG
ncbi:flavin reductase family protein [Collinsella provencensis]|uniref:flavin reductase family protein n=1 Tax=Collinsella provencensis TaxID=1937461 RepID=UPI000C84CF7A|nr:flavin reductase [Collinsella provencensis]